MKGIADHKKLLYIFLVLESLLILVIHLYNINSLYGFFLSEDELGYWGNAAYFAGKNWGNAVASCGYYSYGYSFFLLPILSLPVSPLTMYQLAIVLNALFILASFYISFYLFIHLFPNKNRLFISIICTAMTLYAAYVSWSSVAWSECCLSFFVWLIILQGYLIIEKITMPRILVFAFELGFIYMIHQRTVSFLIAGVLYVIVLNIYKKIKVRHFVAFLITIVVILILAFLIKTLLQEEIYTSDQLRNDYSSIISGINLSNLFTPVIREIFGQFFYLWAASFGIIPLGIGFTIAKIIKKWKERDKLCWFYSFILLSFFGIIGVSSIYMRLVVSRIDQLIYGRYNEIVVGFFIVLGFLELSEFIKQKNSWKIIGISSIVFIGLGLLILNKIDVWNVPIDTYYQGVCAAGIFWFYQFRGFRVLELCIWVLVEELFLILLLKLFKPCKWLIFVEVIFIIICWTISGKMVVQQQIIPYQQNIDLDIAENTDFWESVRKSDMSVAFLSNTEFNIRGSIQFYLQDIPLECISELNSSLKQPDILIVDNDNSIMNAELDNYKLGGFIGIRSIYTKDDILIEGLNKELSTNIFYYNDIPNKEEGYVMYGPYIILPSGEYEFTCSMKDSGEQEDVLGVFEIVSNGNVLATTSWSGMNSTVSMRVRLEDVTNSIECRYFKNIGNDTRPLAVFVQSVSQ